MTFEKDLHYEINSLDIPVVWKMQIEENVLSIKNKYCFDKTKVKEVISKFHNKALEYEYEEPTDAFDEIDKELGLNDL